MNINSNIQNEVQQPGVLVLLKCFDVIKMFDPEIESKKNEFFKNKKLQMNQKKQFYNSLVDVYNKMLNQEDTAKKEDFTNLINPFEIKRSIITLWDYRNSEKVHIFFNLFFPHPSNLLDNFERNTVLKNSLDEYKLFNSFEVEEHFIKFIFRFDNYTLLKLNLFNGTEFKIFTNIGKILNGIFKKFSYKDYLSLKKTFQLKNYEFILKKNKLIQE